jgi:hypothetical protein
MPATPYLNQLRVMKDLVPGTDILGEVLTELLAVSANNKTFFNITTGSANCVGLYKAGTPWGALINFKAGNIPSFVHELTHASCFESFKSDLINYSPKKANTVAYTFTNNSIPHTPNDTRACTNEPARRAGWHDLESGKFLTLNLNNLEAWADVTDFSAPLPWLDAMKVKEMSALEKTIKKGRGTIADMNKLQSMQADNQSFGVLVSPKKKKDRAAALQAEADRKRAYIKERINYGRIGMSGMGDVHFEYDTVVNQMLCQMFMWGFRPSAPLAPSLPVLAAQVQSSAVPAGYFYGQLAIMARDAYARRRAALQIAAGTAPVVTAPARVINPPSVS